MEDKDVYLGDGVYASYDGYQIWLKTKRDNGWHEIALEPSVFNLLVRYKNNLRKDKSNG